MCELEHNLIVLFKSPPMFFFCETATTDVSQQNQCKIYIDVRLGVGHYKMHRYVVVFSLVYAHTTQQFGVMFLDLLFRGNHKANPKFAEIRTNGQRNFLKLGDQTLQVFLFQADMPAMIAGLLSLLLDPS